MFSPCRFGLLLSVGPARIEDMPRGIAVAVEVTPKKAFAFALDWPGWCRSGRSPEAALEALAEYAERFEPVATAAGITFPSRITFDVVEQLPGGSTTAFGAPEMTTEADRQPVTAAAAKRMAALVTAAWSTFDAVAAVSPAELRKGPRGGGRDRDKMIDHVLDAENSYARMLGIKLKSPARGDNDAIEAQRLAIAAVLGAPSDGTPVVPNRWTTRYAARRIAWHVLDHAWEMQDRARPGLD
jgi:hypothetical protein